MHVYTYIYVLLCVSTGVYDVRVSVCVYVCVRAFLCVCT